MNISKGPLHEALYALAAGCWQEGARSGGPYAKGWERAAQLPLQPFLSSLNVTF